MGCCKGCSKFILACVNILTIISGLGLATAGIIILVNGHDYIPEISQFSNSLNAPCGVLIVLGFVGSFVGAFGCYATFSGRTGFLNGFFYLIFALTLIEVAAVVAAGIKKDYISEESMSGIEYMFERVNHDNASEWQMAIVSNIQLALTCCGLGGNSRYWTMWDDSNAVPSSCCGSRAEPTSKAYYCSRWDLIASRDSSCKPPLLTLLEISIWTLIGLLIGFILLNVWLMVSAKVLRKWIREDEYVYTRYDDINEAASSYTGKTLDSDKTHDTGFNSTWL